MRHDFSKKGYLKRFLLIGLAVVFAGLSPISTYALSSPQLNMFSQNNILFYMEIIV